MQYNNFSEKEFKIRCNKSEVYESGALKIKREASFMFASLNITKI
jgi:hypothetical protein